MPLAPSDLILGGRPRGTATQWKRALKAAGAKRLPDVYTYVDTVFVGAPFWGLDPSLVVAQAAHETGNFGAIRIEGKRDWWSERLNPAGMGITGDPVQDEASWTWESGAHAARSQMAHLLLYTTGRNETGWWNPREGAYRAKYGPNSIQARVIEDLGGGKWAADSRYGEKVAERGNALVPGLPDQQSIHDPVGEKPVALQIDKRLTQRSFGRLRDAKAYITIHSNGNPSSDRFDESAFANSGGGGQGVLYTGAIDDGGTVFITAMSTQGRHAGNSEGNQISAAFELCEGANYEKMRENVAQTLFAILTGDPRVPYGSFTKDNFSRDRIVEHRDWGRTVGIGEGVANGGCPAVVIRNDGSIDAWILKRLDQLLADAQPKPPAKPRIVKRTPLTLPLKPSGSLIPLSPKRYQLQSDMTQYASAKAQESNLASTTKLKRGRTLTFEGATVGVDSKGRPALFFVSKNGTYGLASEIFGR